MKLNTIFAVIAFLFLFCFFYLSNKGKLNKINKKKLKKNKEYRIIAVEYLKIKFSINKERLLTNDFMIVFALIDSFIIAFVFWIILLFKIYFIFKLIIGFILLLGLIYALYELLGRLLVKKGYQNEHKRD